MDAIPDIGDYTIKKKKQGREFAPAPDTLLQKALAEKRVGRLPGRRRRERSQFFRGKRSVFVLAKLSSDLTAVGEGRGAVLGLKLDGMADSVSGQTVVDPKGYLTSLGGVKVSSESDVADIKKARLLLKSVIGTIPKHAPGWIAARGWRSSRGSSRRRGASRSAGATRVSHERGRLARRRA